MLKKHDGVNKEQIINRILAQKFPKKIEPQREERKLSLTLLKNEKLKETQKPARKEAEINWVRLEPYNPVTLAFIGDYDLEINKK